VKIVSLIILLLAFGYVRWFWEPTPAQPKPVAITIPDSRISDLELKVRNLENWAQRQGMKY
jgi:hypothetical protein